MRKNIFYIFFVILGTVIILWQLLLPGYVLSLDLVFGPYVNFFIDNGVLVNTLPIKYIFVFITTICGGWVTEKILLIAIVFLLFYLPLHFFKKIFNLIETGGAEYVVAVAYAINPFVYERLLAGQWAVVFGYALLVPVISYLFDFCRAWSVKNGVKLAVMITVLGVISLHYFVMCSIVIALACIVNFFAKKERIKFLLAALAVGCGIIVLSLYWTVPALHNPYNQVGQFSADQWQVFKTVGSGSFGTLKNVLTLHGFWEENQHWASRFVMVQNKGWAHTISLSLGIILVLLGMYAGINDRRMRKRLLFLLGIAALAAIFSCGVGEGIFSTFNMWIFQHVSFWKGFRDSQKWSGFVALAYAFLLGLGTIFVQSRLRTSEYKRIAVMVCMAVPLFFTPMILFGFSGELAPVMYPADWTSVNTIIKTDQSCRALFLPWHQYYSLAFNNDLLTGNVSRDFFDCDVVEGKNMEIGDIETQGGNGEEYYAIESIVTSNTIDPDAAVQLLLQHNIRYVIYTPDVAGEDEFKYPFLSSARVKKVFTAKDIDLYTLH